MTSRATGFRSSPGGFVSECLAGGAAAIRGARARGADAERILLQSRLFAYAVAGLVTIVTVAGRHALDSAWGTTKPFMLFFPAVMLSARLGGFGPGVFSTVLSSLAIDYLWTAPFGRFHVPESKNVASFVVFVASGLLISALSGSLHAAIRRAKSLHDARETLLAVVAHDLRNPLGAISMNVAHLHRGSRSAEALARALGSIDRSVVRMERLISDVLDASRLEAGQLEVVLRPEPIGAILRDALDAVLASASAKQVELTSSVAATLPLVRCDRERVLQILGNLLANAIKFTPAGRKIALAATRTGRVVQITVSDSGPGIEPGDLAHVFDRYWRKGAGGTGLGLYIVKGLVDAHGGRAWVESEPGEGTRAFVTLLVAE